MEMVILVNDSNVYLPTPVNLNDDEKKFLRQAQPRAHLDHYDEDLKLEPLTEEEQLTLRELEQRFKDARTPTVGGVAYKFEPGDWGWFPADIAALLLEQAPRRLRQMKKEELSQITNQPRYHGHSGFKELRNAQLASDPDPVHGDWTIKHVMTDGVLVNNSLVGSKGTLGN